MSFELCRYDGAAIAADALVRDQLAELYTVVFGEPPYDEPAGRGHDWAHGALVRHAALPGFELVTAEQAGAMVGFAYGAIGSNTDWFSGYIREHAPAVADDWLGGQGNFAELAVHPRARGQGIGGALHDAVMDHLAEVGVTRSLLMSRAEAIPARRLYATRGWHDLVELAPGSILMGTPRPADSLEMEYRTEETGASHGVS